MKKYKVILLSIITGLILTGCSKWSMISDIRNAEIATITFSVDPNEPSYNFSGTEVKQIVSLIEVEKWKSENPVSGCTAVGYINFYEADKRYILEIINTEYKLMFSVSVLEEGTAICEKAYYYVKNMRYDELMDSLKEFCDGNSNILL